MNYFEILEHTQSMSLCISGNSNQSVWSGNVFNICLNPWYGFHHLQAFELSLRIIRLSHQWGSLTAHTVLGWCQRSWLEQSTLCKTVWALKLSVEILTVMTAAYFFCLLVQWFTQNWRLSCSKSHLSPQPSLVTSLGLENPGGRVKHPEKVRAWMLPVNRKWHI